MTCLRMLWRAILVATVGTVMLGSTVRALSADGAPEDSRKLLRELKSYPHKLVYETNRDGNWELYLCDADGSGSVNVTRTPDVDELYPKPSPDGSRICFVADLGKGDEKVR